VARWRVGLRGTVVLSIDSGAASGEFSGTIAVSAVADAMLDAHRGSSHEGLHALRGRLGQHAGEMQIEITSCGIASAVGACCVVIGADESDRPPLLLTGVPTALGLRGGTYVLEHVRVASA
jgi:hypothetical protein